MKSILYLLSLLFAVSCMSRRQETLPQYDSLYDEAAVDSDSITRTDSSRSAVGASTQQSGSDASHRADRFSGRSFSDGYGHGLEDAEDDADHSRYDRHKRHSSDYDRGYNYGYQESEEDDEWEDDGGDPEDPENF